MKKTTNKDDKLMMCRQTLYIQASRALCALADSWKGTPRYYQINKVIQDLWKLKLAAGVIDDSPSTPSTPQTP